MKALLRKDLYQLVSVYKVFLVMLVVMAFAAARNGQLVGFAMLYSALLLPISLMLMDEQSQWDSLALMLPYSRTALVVEKYVAGWICVAVPLLLSLAFQALWAAVGVSEGFAPASLLVYGTIALVFQAVSMPFSFRFGTERGRFFSIFFILLFAAVTTALLNISDGDALAGLLSAVERVPLILWPLLSAALCAASIPLSVKGYVKRLEK